MPGTLLDGAAILVGGLAGWLSGRELPAAWQNRLRVLTAVVIAFAGLRVAWLALPGDGGWLRFSVVVLAAAVAGGFVGALLRLQKLAQGAARFARDRFTSAARRGPVTTGDGLLASAALFAVTPLAFSGPVIEGAAGDPSVLAAKALLDGLAAVSLGRVFRGGTLLAALPVVAWQGSLTLALRFLAPAFTPPALAALLFTAGWLTAAVALVALDVRKVQWAGLLPALVLAPLFGAWWG